MPARIREKTSFLGVTAGRSCRVTPALDFFLRTARDGIHASVERREVVDAAFSAMDVRSRAQCPRQAGRVDNDEAGQQISADKGHCDSTMARRRRSSELILWACQKEVSARPVFCFAGVPARSLQVEVRYTDRHHEQFSVRGVVGLARENEVFGREHDSSSLTILFGVVRRLRAA
jgi:hypothetical protein